MVERLYIMVVAVLDAFIWIVDVGPQVHKFFLMPQLGDFREFFGKIRAIRVYRMAAKNVPAYRDYLSKHPHNGPTVTRGIATLGDIPEMDKSQYIKQYPLTETLQYGRLPTTGVMFDESSGSSGTPTSWVRGRRERRMTRRIMQVAFQHLIGDRQPIILNAFSMGAWATGFNTSTCLLEIGRIKSIGPDVTKIIDTMLEFGPEYDYLILGYPPFLRQLTARPEIDWQQYHISAVFGGEGMSESMRQYLLRFYRDVVGSYGASDLEINIAHETDFSIALRKALAEDPDLRKALLKQNRGIIPMVFQYNPYDYLFETNQNGELLVTICRTYNLSPRIRYNIHDVGHASKFYDLRRTLKKHGYASLLEKAEFDFGVLFHYGRSDLSVDYNGAVVGPEEVRQIIENDELSDAIETFRLISYEDDDAKKHLLLAVEQSSNAQPLTRQKGEQLLERIIASLQLSNLDFASGLRTAELRPEIRVFKYREGIFDSEHTKLKNDYIWNIDAESARREGII